MPLHLTRSVIKGVFFPCISASCNVVRCGKLDVRPEIFYSEIRNAVCDLLMFRSGCLHGEILD